MTAYVRQLAVTAILAFVVAICTPVFVHRRDFVAFSQWRQNQTAENTALLNTQVQKNQWVVLRFELAAGGIVFVALNAGWLLTRRLKCWSSHR